MKKRNPLRPCLIIPLALILTCNAVHAGSHATFSDSWHDSYSSSQHAVVTSGNFIVNVTLPLNGIDLSELDIYS